MAAPMGRSKTTRIHITKLTRLVPAAADTATTAAKIGSIAGRHRHDGFLAFQVLYNGVGPTAVQHIHHLALINAIVRHQHQCHVITDRHAREVDIAPGSPVSRHSVPDIAQRAPQPSYSVWQASRRTQGDDGKARCRRSG